jgi:hypothetical protein
MRASIRPDALLAALALASGVFATAAGALTLPGDASPLKATQIRMLLEEPMRERREFAERARELRRLAREFKAGRHAPTRARGDRARFDGGDEDVLRLGAAPRGPAASHGAGSVHALAPNVRCNDPAGDLLTPGLGTTVVEGQCETAIARWNDQLVAAWNDGKGFDDGSFQTQGWATSADGGVTWTDRGTFPLPARHPGWKWTSDPVLAVNPSTGAFYFAALGTVPGSFSSVGVIKGRFSGGVFAWETPSVPRLVPISSQFMDKEWLAVDPADGRVFLTYSRFIPHSDQIDFQYADSALSAWSSPREISLPNEHGRVQGSRPVVGPDGTVYVVYYLVGLADLDYFRIARSFDRGTTFSEPNDAASFYSNYGTGAPGFNRHAGVQFPSVAVDRSGGAHDGRLHLAWTESLNWYDDMGTVGAGSVNAEVEPNEDPATATKVLPGQTVHGTFWYLGETDFYAVSLAAGQTLIGQVDSLENGQAVTFRLYASDGVTRLAYMQVINTQLLPGYAPPTWVFTAPVSATYYLRVVDVRSFGRYRFKTGLATQGAERGRDHRDVFSSYSDDAGYRWSSPQPVDHDPPGYDGWLPEIAVTPSGQVGCAWYDWRDSPPSTCGGESSIYLATSDNGGASWRERGAVTDVRTNWTWVGTNVVPNQGDYMALHADARGFALAWADGRGGNPDTYMAAVPLAGAALVSGVAPAAPGALSLVTDAGPAGASAHLAFATPQAGPVRLSVIDLQGRRVASLLDSPLPAGAHTREWNLADASGRRVGAGIYWAVLESGGRRASVRMIVLR